VATVARKPGQRRLTVLIAVLVAVAASLAVLAPGAGAVAGFVPVSGSGSTWSSNALDQWRRAEASQEGITVNYSPNGSTSGRNDFRNGQVDFAVSEIPYGLSDGGVLDPNPPRAFGYLPIVAGGTSFMYNLRVGGNRVTNLRLSGDTLTKIFTQVITNWSDAAVQADNPGLTLPARKIVPVVYSNGSGPTAQFTAWMANQYPALWDDYCHRNGRNITPCGFTSFYPIGPGMEAKAQSQGVTGFVAQDTSEGAITFVEQSYARNAGFPVAKILNKAGYYVGPTAGNVAVALLQTKINADLTSDLRQVYVNPDPRTYPLSSYSYMIIPKDTSPDSHFNTEKGKTLSEFAAYSLCEGQQQADTLGYSPLPINLVQAGVDQINQIPGSTHKLDRNNLSGCHNPTVSPDGGNLVAENAPQPDPCDLKGAIQCGGGTGPPTPAPIPTPVPTQPPVPTPLPTPTPAPGPPNSAMTVSGTGQFANLKVTVSQINNLINQAVGVSWTGGLPTIPSSGGFGVNYLQIMQCWGDDPAGPDRTQCQYSGSDNQKSPAAGDFVRTRQVSSSLTPVDPKEALKPSPGSPGNAFVPFWAAGRDKPTGPANSDSNDFFDSQVTNEVPLARTHGDGTGQELFEIQTVRQAAGLGCGDPVTTGGATTGRSCWLVIVPRGTTEVDGSTRTAQSDADRLESSPLSQSNWDNRIVVPLAFQPVGRACPIGAPERQVIGHELAVDTVSSWQPALCAGGGALYSYTQLTDDVTRSQVLGGSSPGLALVTNPIPPDQMPADHPLVYAPVGLSGLTIAFNIEHQPPSTAPPADLQHDGQRFTSMKLTPRLVAKLLTQSYQGAVVGPPDYLKNNPAGLTVDPEFLALNPEYKGFANLITPSDALVQLGGSDLTSLLWSWVTADPDANAFLAGTPDPFGMVVNPNNKNLTLPTSTSPVTTRAAWTATSATASWARPARSMFTRSPTTCTTRVAQPAEVIARRASPRWQETARHRSRRSSTGKRPASGRCSRWWTRRRPPGTACPPRRYATPPASSSPLPPRAC
jgi:phosphate ABC transporter phosphate-binding protein